MLRPIGLAFAPMPRSLLLVLLVVVVGCRRSAPDASHGTPVEDAAFVVQPDTRVLDKFRQPDRLVAALGLHAGDAVAEVGAGAGYLTPHLARAVGPGGRVVSTDIDAEALAVLERRARALGLSQVTTRHVAADDPQLEPGAYDLVFLAQVDHLLPDRARYLRALIPALKPGGRIAISNRDRWKQGLLDDARNLPLVLVEEPVGLPSQFLIFLAPAPPRPDLR